MTTNIGIILTTSLFGPFHNAKQPKIYIKDKAWKPQGVETPHFDQK